MATPGMATPGLAWPHLAWHGPTWHGHTMENSENIDPANVFSRVAFAVIHRKPLPWKTLGKQKCSPIMIDNLGAYLGI